MSPKHLERMVLQQNTSMCHFRSHKNSKVIKVAYLLVTSVHKVPYLELTHLSPYSSSSCVLQQHVIDSRASIMGQESVLCADHWNHVRAYNLVVDGQMWAIKRTAMSKHQ
jgi:hypothetical protein